ncbi:MAG: DUF488 domain-containing protein [Candidatus Nanopelagicales bacterium]|nr:DUF488 domain-containing protein [Candidatus Nanopelagicales bacterium]
MASADTTVHVTGSGTAPRLKRAEPIGEAWVNGGHVVSLGYEGLVLSEVLAEVARAHVEVLVDVRLTPVSRKKGLSKTALSRALDEIGVRYVHMRGLGNPKDNRPGFVAGEHAARERFTRLMRGGDGRRDMDALRVLAADYRVGLLCFERDEAQCHRSLIARELTGNPFQFPQM